MGEHWGYPQIGSKYNGPSLDRPCLRVMPPGWVLEEARTPAPAKWYLRTDRLVAIVVALLLLVACAQAIIQVIKAPPG
jgi:hypothetical protein